MLCGYFDQLHYDGLSLRCEYDDLKVQAKEGMVHCVSLNIKQFEMSSYSLLPTEVFWGV